MRPHHGCRLEGPPNMRMQRTHSRVTPLAEGRKRRATRRAAFGGGSGERPI